MPDRPPMPLVVGALLAGLAGCTEEPIVAVDPDVPGASVPTVEVSARASELGGWRDTTFVGFELPATAGFQVLADGTDLQSRILGRFDIPDSVTTFTGSEEIETFVAAEFRIGFAFDEDPDSIVVSDYRLRVFELQQSYDSLEASWTERTDGEPWTVPGGTLGRLLATGVFTAALDTAIIELSVPVDSVLKGWQERDGEPGVALLVSGGLPEFFVRSFDLGTEVTVVGRTDTVPATFQARAPTFIYDPAQPPLGQRLRIAGVPSARLYLEFALPDSLGGFPLRQATINHAEVRFRPLAEPAEPFVLEREILTTSVEVLGNAFEVGAKVPVGPPIPDPLTNTAQFITLSPANLADGQLLRVNVTALVARVAAADTLTQVRMAVRPAPNDAQAFGFWDFGSVESPLPLQPELLMLVTPPLGFPVP